MATQTDRGVPLSTLSPKFLHTNSTSHTWPFSAIAELIDNAYDPDVSAKQFWIDKTVVKGETCLTFMDNGNGLDHQTMHKMLSFGYSDKIAINGLEPIGIYGNGFKSGSMRLGKDAIVFSKSKKTSCVGMLSQTYLEKIGAKQIIVPIVCFEETESNKFSVREEHKASLRDILQYSPFQTMEELLDEINIITLACSSETGTRIIIWNLRRTSTGSTEFDFEKDRYDIRIPSEVYEMMNNPSQLPDHTVSYTPESFYSLRAYCSILYLKPRMQVMIRGQKVKSQLIAKSLACIRKDHYRPNFLKRIPITFGYNTKSKEQYGIMMYHKNRLIKAYERVGCQLKANSKGVGVIGVIECNFLDPTHNKQSFIETDKYRKTMTSLGIKLEEYWNEIRYRRTKENPYSTVPVEDTMKRPDQNWVQCDECLQWRKLPDGIDCSKLPDKWFCRMNPDPQFRSCQVEEEPEDSDDEQPSYRKTYKLQEREDRRKQERKLEQERYARQNQALKREQDNPTWHQTSPSTPTTPRGNSLRGSATRDEFSLRRSSKAASSPSSSSGFPIITSVCSLSVNSNRGKRTHPITPQSTPKRPRVNGVQQEASNTPSSSNVSSPSVLTDHSDDDGDDDDDTDDDIFILDEKSTPKPQKPAVDVGRVKKEKEESEIPIPMLLECSDDAAVDDPAGTSSAASAAVETGLPPAVATSTTQTEVREVKREEESQTLTQGKVNATQSKPDESGAVESSDVNICSGGERKFKQDGSQDSQMEDQGEQVLQNGVAQQESERTAGPACALGHDTNCSPHQFPSINEIQEQQDQLLELMQQTAQERDLLKDQVQKLNSQLQDAQSRLPELSQMYVKKESSHQACQTEDTKDYKSLFEKAKQKINNLIKDKAALLSAAETTARLSSAQDEEKELDEISLQVGYLVEKLNERNKERDELRSQLDSLQEEKSNLAARCEELRLSLQHQREIAQSGGSADSGTHSSSDASKSLVELRQNVGRLLVSHVPALDLQQVNYECNVIDEILDQVLSSMDSI